MPAMNGIARYNACVIGCAASKVKKPTMRPWRSITGCSSRPARGSSLERQPLEADAVLDQVHKARIDCAARAEQVAEFTDRGAQRGALLGGAAARRFAAPSRSRCRRRRASRPPRAPPAGQSDARPRVGAARARAAQPLNPCPANARQAQNERSGPAPHVPALASAGTEFSPHEAAVPAAQAREIALMVGQQTR